MTGQRFGNWVVEKRASNPPKTCQVFWECVCDCGARGVVGGTALRRGTSTHCGCKTVEKRLNTMLRNHGGQHPLLINLVGKRFGRLTVIERDPQSKPKSVKWICKCDCGNTTSVNSQLLRNGHTVSCGCYQRERTSEVSTTHGGSKDRLFHVWSSMRQRCNNPNNHAYKYYGGKGISVCNEWNDYGVFREWALASGYNTQAKPHVCTLDRIDNSRGYSPDNCRWVDSTVQTNNQTKNIYLTFNGKTQTYAQWAKEKGWNYKVIYDRVKRYGWSEERAVTEPVRRW